MDAATRRQVERRAGHRCEFCHLPQRYAPAARFQVEHVRPKQHGGSDARKNLALACPRCNRFKGPNLTAINSKSRRIVPLFNPRTQNWRDHFALVGIDIVGLTAVVRATVRLLNMNGEDRLKVRAALRERDELDV